MYKLVVVALTLLGLIGCATKANIAPHIQRPANESLKEAATKYWNYIIQGDLYHSYDYEHVAFSKKVTRQFYMNKYMKGLQFINFKILKIGPEGSGPDGTTPVLKEVEYKIISGLPFQMKKTMKIKRTDYWLKEKDGRWYHALSVAGNLYK